MNYKLLQKTGVICLLVLSTFCQAQITITKSDMPKDGDTLRYSNTASLGSYTVDKTGADYTWDFSDLNYTTQGVAEYKSSLKTPYLFNFGFSAIGLKIADTLGVAPLQFKNVYTFYKTSSSKFTAVGTGFQYSALPLPQTGKHSDPDEIFQFPLEFGDKDVSTFDVKVDLKAGFLTVGSYIQKGTRTTEVDGWGIITTPFAENVKCIRVKSYIDGFDSIAVTTPKINFGRKNVRVEYRWLTNTEHIPLMEVSGVEVGGNFIPNNIRYRDSFRKRDFSIGPKASFTISDTDLSIGELVTVENTSKGLNQSIKWTITPSEFTFEKGDKNADNIELKFQKLQNYNIKLWVSNGFIADSISKTISVTTLSIKEPINAQTFKMYPNPSEGSFTVEIDPNSTSRELKIYNILGKLVYSKPITQNINQINMPLSPGLYHVLIDSKDSKLRQRLIIR